MILVRFFMALLLVACFCRQVPTTPAVERAVVDTPQTGSISGSVIYRGEVPRSKFADDHGTRRHLLSVDEKTGGLGHVMLYLEASGENAPPLVVDKPASGEADEVVVDQKNYTFQPRVIGVREGQPVKFTSSDVSNHNVRGASLEPKNEFNVFTGYGEQYVQRFRADRKQRPVLLGCDIHPWMRGWVYVFRHPYHAVSDAQGKFCIDRVPPGEYRLQVRQPDGGLSAERVVTVRAGKTAPLQFEFTQNDLKVR